MSDNQLSVRPIKAKSSRSRRQAAQTLATKPVMLLVLGMHRSGTSVCARMLECFGPSPSRNLNPPNFANPKGYFEDFDIYQFNDSKMLPPLRRAWHSTAPVDWSLLSDADRSRLALDAVQILRGNFAPSSPFSVLKEPRIGMLLPFWLSVLSHAGYEVKVVCALRDPVSVARSLWQRDKFTTARSGLLYLSYWLSILNCLRSLPVAFVQFDEVFTDPKDVLQRVARKLGLQEPPDFAERVEEFRADFLTKDLRHHRFHVRDLDLEPEMPPLTLELYRNLLRAAQAQNIAPLLKFAAATEKELALLQPVLVEFDRAHGAMRNEQARAGQLQARVIALETEAAQRQASDFSRERGALAEQITRLQAEKAELAARASSLESEHSSLATLYSSLVAERDDLATRHSSLVKEREALQSEHSSLATALEQLQGQHSSLVAERDALQTSVDERFGELAILTKKLLAAEEERDALNARLASLDSTVQDLEKQALERGALAEQITQLQAEKDELAARASSLESTHAPLVTRHSSLATALEQLQGQHSSLVAERDALQHSVDERFQELAILTKRLIATEDTLGSERASAKKLQGELAEARLKYSEARGQLAEKLTRYQAMAAFTARRRGALAEKVTKLETVFNQRTASLRILETASRSALGPELRRSLDNNAPHADLAQQLLTRLGQLEKQADDLQTITSSVEWKIAQPLGRLSGASGYRGKRKAKYAKLRKLVEDSGLFDKNYYLKAYPDVARSDLDPLEHFLLHGGAEGRNPSSKFDTPAYLKKNPDVALNIGRLNPLVHFLQFGKKEGRPTH